MKKEWTPADTEEAIQVMKDISEVYNQEQRELRTEWEAEYETSPKSTFKVNLDVDTSGIDAALEKVKELIKLMDKAGILPDTE